MAKSLKYGGCDRDRTCDPLIKSQLLNVDFIGKFWLVSPNQNPKIPEVRSLNPKRNKPERTGND